MNYCTKCGKEITNDENKICEDCKNNLLMDLKSPIEEIEETKNAQEKEVIRDFETEKKSNTKIKSKIFVSIIVIILILAVFLACKMMFSNNNVGVEIGNNNNNFGYATMQNNWIYYMSFSDDSMEVSINKIKTDGTNKTVLAQKDWEIFSINVVGNYIYFIAYEPTTDSNEETQYKNNKIYKMTLDGKNLTVINDNDFSDECISIYVVKDKVYYIGADYNVYSMDTNGENKTQINSNETGYIGVTDNYILFNDLRENPESETDFVTYIMNLDGSDIRQVNGERLYNANVIGEYIYYVNGENSEIHRIKVDGTEDTKIYNSKAYNMNVSGDYIYYLDFKTENSENPEEKVCIHRIKKDGTEHQIIVEMENYSSFINVIGDWIYYTDHNNNSYYINMIKVDGSDTLNLYTYNFQG